MQSRLFANKVIKMTVQGSILEAFGVTLEHFGHQMAPQRHFLGELKIGWSSRDKVRVPVVCPRSARGLPDVPPLPPLLPLPGEPGPGTPPGLGS